MRIAGRPDGVAFLDSSAFLALVSPRDIHHDEARHILTSLTQQRSRTLTTNFVIAETHALFLARLGHAHANSFLERSGESGTTIVRVTIEDERRARSVIFEHADKDYSLTDALSFVVMERLRISQAFTFDGHFKQYGFTVLGSPNT